MRTAVQFGAAAADGEAAPAQRVDGGGGAGGPAGAEHRDAGAGDGAGGGHESGGAMGRVPDPEPVGHGAGDPAGDARDGGDVLPGGAVEVMDRMRAVIAAQAAESQARREREVKRVMEYWARRGGFRWEVAGRL